MKNPYAWLPIVLVLGCATSSRLLAASEPDWEVLSNYCGKCHNADDYAGGIAFDLLSKDSLHKDAVVWERALHMIRSGLMPPNGNDRPSHAKFESFIGQLEQKLDAEAQTAPDPGTEGLARLNRAEYSNAIRDLLAFDASTIVDKLPTDVSEGGFDNISNVLTVSPTLIDAYVSTAMRISREAVGDQSMIPTQVKYPSTGGIQSKHVEGLPLGTRGGMLVTHNFPLNAKYQIKVSSGSGGGIFNNQSFCQGPSLVVMINGEPLEVEKPQDFTLEFPAGPQTIGVAMVDDKHCVGVNEFYDDYALSGAVQGIEIDGPFEAAGPGDSPSRDAIFSCYPHLKSEESGCARQIMSRLASAAFRRPVANDSPELRTLMSFYERGAQKGNFEMGIQYALSRLLIDPRFLYRIENEPEALAKGELYKISDLELASRLSFFLWSSIPDQTLIDLAVAGKLSEPANIEQQVKRMLADPKAKAIVENFAGQWLKLRELDAALPQDRAFTPSLKSGFRSETEMLFMDLIAQDKGLLFLLNADYTYLNEELASHYGIAGVRGSYMRKVALPAASPRRGLLGQGSILTATSVANRTSPVVRGKWIIENILGAPELTPPPGVVTDLTKNQDDDGRIVHTLRERLELHLKDPVCASCHQVMDPLGFALENFDLIGRWRDSDNGYPLNTKSEMVDGTLINNATDMRNALLERSDTIATTITEKLMTYALGRVTQATDMPAIRKIMRETRKQDYRFSTVVLGIVNSSPFRMKIAMGSSVAQNIVDAGTP